MKHTAAKAIRALCGMVVMLALAAGITSVPVLAASNGIYVAKATPHYRHPVTGVIEDVGGDGSAVLGQSMTESVLYRQALVEVDPQGNTYITVRLKLMDNIRDPEFHVDGNAADASLMQEDYSVNTADYRMRVNSENSVIRCNMFVIPMGREVIFYITVADLVSGSEDFITSVKVETPITPAQPEPEPPTQPDPPAQPEPPAEPEAPAEPEQPAETQNPSEVVAPSVTTVPETSAPVSEATTRVTSALTTARAETTAKNKDEKPVGLQEFDASGNRMDEEKTTDPEKGGSSAVWWVLGGLLVVAVGGFCVWYFVFFKKKKK